MNTIICNGYWIIHDIRSKRIILWKKCHDWINSISIYKIYQVKMERQLWIRKMIEKKTNNWNALSMTFNLDKVHRLQLDIGSVNKCITAQLMCLHQFENTLNCVESIIYLVHISRSSYPFSSFILCADTVLLFYNIARSLFHIVLKKNNMALVVLWLQYWCGNNEFSCRTATISYLHLENPSSYISELNGKENKNQNSVF